MKKFEEIIKTIINIKGFKSEAKLAEYFELHPQALNRYKKQNSMPFEKIIGFCERENVSLDWLLPGREPEIPAPPSDLERRIAELERKLK